MLKGNLERIVEHGIPILPDSNMPGMCGLELLPLAKAARPG